MIFSVQFHVNISILASYFFLNPDVEKQPSRGVLEKRSSENMQQIYRRTPMPKRDFNKVTKQFF